MNQQPQPTSLYPVERGDELDLIGLWKVLVEHKLLIIIFTTLTTLSATYYALTLPTIYKAETLIIPSNGTVGNGGFGLPRKISATLGLDLSGDSNAGFAGEEALTRLKTRSFLINFINEKRLKSVLFHRQWEKKNGHWIGDEPTNYEAYKMLHDMIFVDINPRNKIGLVGISLKFKNPDNLIKVAEIINDLVGSMNFHAKQREILELKNNISFLEKEMEKTDLINFQAILYSLIEKNMSNIMMVNATDEFVFKVIDPAFTPRKPEPNKVEIFIILGVIFGVIFSSFLVIFLKSLKNNE
jgi:LPS O-antigen subunit length determinant protein (WzzB/FepE family)